LEKEGIVIKKIDHYNNWWHPPTIVISLFPNLDPQKAWQKEQKKSNPILERLLWIFWTLALPPFTFFESLKQKSAIVTVFAGKKF